MLRVSASSASAIASPTHCRRSCARGDARGVFDVDEPALTAPAIMNLITFTATYALHAVYVTHARPALRSRVTPDSWVHEFT